MKQKQRVFSLFLLSPSSRRAWIEIAKSTSITYCCLVALLAEGVDRNFANRVYHRPPQVALLAEGVDRNDTSAQALPMAAAVALLAEGVDRNNPRKGVFC